MNLIDTNVIIRFLTADENPRFKGAYVLFSRLEDNLEKVELWLSCRLPPLRLSWNSSIITATLVPE